MARARRRPPLKPRRTPRRLAGARSLAFALLAAVVAAPALSGCDARDATARVWARQLALDPPQLWRAETLGPSGQVWESLDVCADSKLRAGFTRADPDINGHPCQPIGQTVSKPGLYAFRCQALGRTFAVSVAHEGGGGREFTVRYAVTEFDPPPQVFARTLRYRLVGPCPAGWRIGDRSPAGRPQPVDALG